MGLKFANKQGKNLYEFWGKSITNAINEELESASSPLLVNLASHEYFKSIQKEDVHAEIITPTFKDLKNERYKIISIYAKKARGQMARYIIENQLEVSSELKYFNIDNYKFNEFESSPNEIVFTRDHT